MAPEADPDWAAKRRMFTVRVPKTLHDAFWSNARTSQMQIRDALEDTLRAFLQSPFFADDVQGAADRAEEARPSWIREVNAMQAAQVNKEVGASIHQDVLHELQLCAVHSEVKQEDLVAFALFLSLKGRLGDWQAAARTSPKVGRTS